jgi:moderate conductance mechanosensitive channel
MAEDPEFSRTIIEPLKRKGVDQFGDYGFQIRCKMTTRLGGQFVIRRNAFPRIKQAFDENGIRFASPTVRVAGGEAAAPAPARQAVERLNPRKPTGT